MRFFVFLENRLCARVLGIGGKRGKGDRRDLRKRHQSFALTLTWCPAVCVTESNGPSPSPSSASLQCMSRKVSVLHPSILLRLNFLSLRCARYIPYFSCISYISYTSYTSYTSYSSYTFYTFYTSYTSYTSYI